MAGPIQLFYDGGALTYNGDGLYYFPSVIAIPLLQISGGMATEADIFLPLLSASGCFATDGSVALPLLAISGRTRDSIDGEVLLYGLQFDGEVGVSARIDSDITLSLLTITGDMQADGEVRLHLLSIGGSIQHEGRIDCDMALPRTGLSGSMMVTTWMTGSIELHALAVDGGMTAAATSISGSMALHLLSVLGSMAEPGARDFGTETDRTLRYAASRRHI